MQGGKKDRSSFFDGVRSVLRWLKPRIIPTMLVIAGVLMLIWIVVRADDITPPSAQDYGLVVFFASAFNIAGGYTYSRIGRANPSHARSAVRRLISVVGNITDARQVLISDSDAGTDVRVGIAAAWLAATTPHLENAIEDWIEVHPEALEEVMEAWRRSEHERPH